jgi:hypothetical protein
MQREREKKKKQGGKKLVKNTAQARSEILNPHACIRGSAMHAWGLGMHPPPRKPETFAKKSHRRSPNKRTNHTS